MWFVTTTSLQKNFKRLFLFLSLILATTLLSSSYWQQQKSRAHLCQHLHILSSNFSHQNQILFDDSKINQLNQQLSLFQLIPAVLEVRLFVGDDFDHSRLIASTSKLTNQTLRNDYLTQQRIWPPKNNSVCQIRQQTAHSFNSITLHKKVITLYWQYQLSPDFNGNLIGFGLLSTLLLWFLGTFYLQKTLQPLQQLYLQLDNVLNYENYSLRIPSTKIQEIKLLAHAIL